MSLGSALKSKLGGLLLPLLLERARSEVESTEEGRAVWSKILKFMDGKKTYTGAVLLALPKVAAVLGASWVAAGGSAETAAMIVGYGGGSVLFVWGIIHKAVKWLDDQTPDDPGTPAAKG